MKKILIGIGATLVLVIIAVAGFFFFNKNKSELGDNKIIKNELENIEYSGENEEGEEEDFNILKKRFSLRGTIMKGDNYFNNNQTILALNEYLKAFKQSPNDAVIIKKIAGVYFELKKFKKSYEYYKMAESSLNEEEKEKLILSVLHSLDLDKKINIKEASNEIKNLNITKDEKIYYINSLACTLNLHECKKVFQDYTNTNTGITFPKLLEVKNAFTNYDNFKTENIYYKDALLIGALFQGKMYNVSNYLGQEMLKKYPNYKPILLVIGKGYYELGDTLKAKEYLTEYFNLDQTNLNVAYLLGDINFKLRDYLTSNIYYNNALQNGHPDRIDLERKLIYNYYLLGDKRGMLKIFSYLVDENDATINDFSLGIYHSILNGRKEDAIKWANIGLRKFENKNGFEVFYGYLGWIEREAGNLDVAENYITNGLKINPRNPLLTLNYGYLEEARGLFDKALIHFKRTQVINGDGEFGELAQREIKQIEDFFKKTLEK